MKKKKIIKQNPPMAPLFVAHKGEAMQNAKKKRAEAKELNFRPNSLRKRWVIAERGNDGLHERTKTEASWIYIWLGVISEDAYCHIRNGFGLYAFALELSFFKGKSSRWRYSNVTFSKGFQGGGTRNRLKWRWGCLFCVEAEAERWNDETIPNLWKMLVDRHYKPRHTRWSVDGGVNVISAGVIYNITLAIKDSIISGLKKMGV
jgi:hypothetical protein